MAGPRRISTRVLDIKITGYLMPALENRQPVLCGMADTNDLFVLLFSTKEKLVEYMAACAIEYDRVQVVSAGADFLESIEEENERGGRPYEIRVAVDPYQTTDGRVRFVEAFSSAS